MNKKIYYNVIESLLLENKKINFRTIGNSKIAFMNLDQKTSPKEYSNSLMIVGSLNFQEKVFKALSFLNKKSPESFMFVRNRTSTIRENDKTGMKYWIKNPVLKLSMKSLESSIYWSSSLFVHEAMHVELHRIGKKPTGKKAELICNLLQKKVLEKLNAPKNIIYHLERFISDDKGRKHWDLDGDGDYDQHDHDLRDW
jgi:hypothetical protein